MSQQSYVYQGPAQTVTLQDAKCAVLWEGALVPGRTVTGLPADHPHVVSWIALDMLVPVAGEAPSEPPAEPVTRRRSAKED